MAMRGSGGRKQAHLEEESDSEGNYRDRAAERRKGDPPAQNIKDNNEEDTEFDPIDVPESSGSDRNRPESDTTLVVGGHEIDVSRFEQIKGLDFSLLAKIRAQTDSALREVQARLGGSGSANVSGEGEEEYNIQLDDREEIAELRRQKLETHTTLGSAVRRFFFPSSLHEDSSANPSIKQQLVRQTVSRSIVVFDPASTDSTGTTTLPPPRLLMTTGRGSRKHVSQERMPLSECLPKDVMERLMSIDIPLKLSQAQQKRQAMQAAWKETKEQAALLQMNKAKVPLRTASKRKVAMKKIDSIYDDDDMADAPAHSEGVPGYTSILEFSDDEDADDLSKHDTTEASPEIDAAVEGESDAAAAVDVIIPHKEVKVSDIAAPVNGSNTTVPEDQQMKAEEQPSVAGDAVVTSLGNLAAVRFVPWSRSARSAAQSSAGVSERLSLSKSVPQIQSSFAVKRPAEAPAAHPAASATVTGKKAIHAALRQQQQQEQQHKLREQEQKKAKSASTVQDGLIHRDIFGGEKKKRDRDGKNNGDAESAGDVFGIVREDKDISMQREMARGNMMSGDDHTLFYGHDDSDVEDGGSARKRPKKR